MFFQQLHKLDHYVCGEDTTIVSPFRVAEHAVSDPWEKTDLSGLPDSRRVLMDLRAALSAAMNESSRPDNTSSPSGNL